MVALAKHNACKSQREGTVPAWAFRLPDRDKIKRNKCRKQQSNWKWAKLYTKIIIKTNP